MNSFGTERADKPLLSILIPTKNRQNTALACIAEAAKGGAAHEVEIVVQDCSDDDSLRPLLAEHGLLGRVEYGHTALPLSMTENWNLGMARVSGEYVTIVGDDDSVLPCILDIARWAGERDCPAVKARQYSHYNWPDLPDPAQSGRLELKRYSGQWEEVGADAMLAANSKLGDEYGNLPLVYHNLVKRSVLEHIRSLSGKYFDSLAPDVYSAYAIACTIDRFVVLDYPMTLIGASARSNTHRATTAQASRHFDEFSNFQFTGLAPSAWQLYASMTDCMVRAFINCGREDLLAHVDFARVFARTIVAEPGRCGEHARKYARAMRSRGKSLYLALPELALKIMGKLALNGLRTVAKPADKADRLWFHEVASISRAIDIQMGWLAAQLPLSRALAGEFNSAS